MDLFLYLFSLSLGSRLEIKHEFVLTISNPSFLVNVDELIVIEVLCKQNVHRTPKLLDAVSIYVYLLN